MEIEPTQADVRLRLAQQDMQNIEKNNMTVESHISPSAMISMGIELEESRHVSLFYCKIFSHQSKTKVAT